MNVKNTTNDAEKQVKIRSPKYPVIGLKDAISKAQKIWDKAGRNEVPIKTLADYWEISKTSSALIGFTAALIKFGIVQDHPSSAGERHIKIASLGIEIVSHPDGSKERVALLKKAALKPEIYAELWDKYQGDIPDDSVISPYLLIQKNFNKSAVAVFLRAFRETISFAKLDSRDINSTAPPIDAITKQSAEQSVIQVKTADSTVFRELPIPLEGGLTARIPYPLSADDFKILLETLELWKNRIVPQLKKPEAKEA